MVHNIINTGPSQNISEVILASKRGPLTRIEKQAMPYKLDLLKSFSKIREASLYEQSTIKNQKSNYYILLDLSKKDPLKLERVL